MIKSILVPLDETRLSEKVLDGIRPILCRADVEVILLRVLEIPADEEVSDELVEATREHLARVVDSLQGVQVITKIRLGDPAEEIHKFALLRQVSLIGMFTHARKGLEHFVMGSVARGVLRRATCPVLLVNPYVLKKPAKSATSLHRILVALDGSKTSEEIIAPVTEFATLLDSKVVLFHEELGIPEFGTRSSHHSEILGPPAERLKALGIEVETQSSLYSEPAVAILEQADRLGSDLIAMTTHGRSGVARGLFGSVAEAVLRQAKNPVLIQRTSNTRAGGDEVQYTKG